MRRARGGGEIAEAVIGVEHSVRDAEIGVVAEVYPEA